MDKGARFRLVLFYVGARKIGNDLQALVPEAYPMNRTRWKRGAKIGDPTAKAICDAVDRIIQVDIGGTWKYVEAYSRNPPWGIPLDAIRRFHGYTQKQVAEALGSTVEELIAAEKGLNEGLAEKERAYLIRPGSSR